MKIDEIKEIPESFATVLASDIAVQQLNPVQIDAIKAGLLKLDKSFVIASPTASGKTLIAELAMIKAILEKGARPYMSCLCVLLQMRNMRDLRKNTAN